MTLPSSTIDRSLTVPITNIKSNIKPFPPSSSQSLSRQCLLCILLVLFIRGQFYIASTFAGTRPFPVITATTTTTTRPLFTSPILSDARTIWQDCSNFLSSNLQDMGDAGRLWLRYAYVGSNPPPHDTTTTTTTTTKFLQKTNSASDLASAAIAAGVGIGAATATMSKESSRRTLLNNENSTSTGNRNDDDYDDKYGCRCQHPELYVSERPRVTAIIQSFNHHYNIGNISESLKAADSVDEVIVCEDGSTDGSLHDWHAVLEEEGHFIIRSNNLHEIRSYNRAMRIASGDIIMLLQDDDHLPNSDEWIKNAQRLFSVLPDLGILGGYIGQTWDYESGIGHEFGDQMSTHGGVRDGQTKPIPFVENNTGIAFMYSECTWIAPLFIHKKVIDRMGGLDLTIAKRGEPGIWQDCILSYEGWMHGFTVGTFHVPFERGVGGHGSASSPMKLKLRERVYQRAVGHANRKFPRRRIHEAVTLLNEGTLTPRQDYRKQENELEGEEKER